MLSEHFNEYLLLLAGAQNPGAHCAGAAGLSLLVLRQQALADEKDSLVTESYRAQEPTDLKPTVPGWLAGTVTPHSAADTKSLAVPTWLVNCSPDTCDSYCVQEPTDLELTVPELIAGAASAVFCCWYYMSKHWLANNALGLAFAVQGIEHLSLGAVSTGACSSNPHLDAALQNAHCEIFTLPHRHLLLVRHHAS